MVGHGESWSLSENPCTFMHGFEIRFIGTLSSKTRDQRRGRSERDRGQGLFELPLPPLVHVLLFPKLCLTYKREFRRFSILSSSLFSSLPPLFFVSILSSSLRFHLIFWLLFLLYVICLTLYSPVRRFRVCRRKAHTVHSKRIFFWAYFVNVTSSRSIVQARTLNTSLPAFPTLFEHFSVAYLLLYRSTS